MAHPFMAAVADGLAERNVATLRYQFPCMEEGSKRPDVPKVAQATVRAAVNEALRLLPGLAVVAGGKSFGGRMTSQAQAASPLPGGQGLVFLGFPLHPAGRPSDERGAHLFEIKIPMEFEFRGFKGKWVERMNMTIAPTVLISRKSILNQIPTAAPFVGGAS